MSKAFTLAALAAAAALTMTPAMADTANGLDPYATGFETPTEADWADWSRGDAGTVYTEFDTFSEASYAGTRTAAPDVAASGVSNAYISWATGTFPSSTGNLYSFSAAESFNVNLTTAATSDPVRVVLQIETWGVNASSVTLNGVAATFSDLVYTTTVDTTIGAATLYQNLYYWDLDSGLSSYTLNIQAPVHTSLTQVAVDIGTVAAVPEPETYAMLLAGLGVMGSIARRRRQAA
jgi:hypothetical protein